MVRLCLINLRLLEPDGEPFALDQQLATIGEAGQIAEWPVQISDRQDKHAVIGRLCVARESHAAIELAKTEVARRDQNNGEKIRENTRFHAEFVMVSTTAACPRLSAKEALDLNRGRWQVELVFRRFKQIAGLGHLPKHDDVSARPWLYGKLFGAFLTEKVISHAEGISPLGVCLR